MFRATVIAAVAALALPGPAAAGECAALDDQTLLCEQDGVFALVDPASGASVEVAQELLAAFLSGAMVEPAPEADGTFEDRLTGFCASGDCPSGLTGAIDQLNGYVPSYQ